MIVEVRLVFSVEPVMIVLIVDPIAVVPVPCRVGVIGVTRIRLFINANLYMYLSAGGVDGERACDDRGQ